MKTIQARIQVDPDHRATIQLPEDVAAGPYDIVVILDAPSGTPLARRPLNLPTLDVGPWPADLSLRREDMYGDWGR